MTAKTDPTAQIAANEITKAINALAVMTSKDWPLLLSPGLREQLEYQLRRLRFRRADGFDSLGRQNIT